MSYDPNRSRLIVDVSPDRIAGTLAILQGIGAGVNVVNIQEPLGEIQTAPIDRPTPESEVKKEARYISPTQIRSFAEASGFGGKMGTRLINKLHNSTFSLETIATARRSGYSEDTLRMILGFDSREIGLEPGSEYVSVDGKPYELFHRRSFGSAGTQNEYAELNMDTLTKIIPEVDPDDNRYKTQQKSYTGLRSDQLARALVAYYPELERQSTHYFGA